VVISISVLTGLLVGASLSILGVQFAAVFGLLAMLLNFVPTIGGIVATLLPIPVILLSPEMSVTAKILAIAIPGGIQAAIGAVQPKIQGDALEIHPVAVLLALIFFGMIWGIAGAFVATPLIAVIKIILERLPATRSVAALLAGDLSMLSLFTRSAPASRSIPVEKPEPQSLVHSAPED
jgi:AI-2 transport protein TqsA